MRESAEFMRFYNGHLAPVEGGVVNHAADAGGHTWYGISSRFLGSIGRRGPLSQAQARLIAFEHFWQQHGCEQMRPVVAWCYCDALFHHRPRVARRMLQHALMVRVDGVVGPITLAAAQSVDEVAFFERYRLRRTRFFVRICQRDSSQLVFLVGWMDRIARLGQSMVQLGLFDQHLPTRRRI